MRRRDWLALGSVALAVALGLTCAPYQPLRELARKPVRAVPWEPWHVEAWHEVSTCLGILRPFPRRLTLHHVGGEPQFFDWLGLYAGDRGHIYLRTWTTHDTGVLKHEFVHHLEYLTGQMPDGPFIRHGPLFDEAERCGFYRGVGP